MAAVLAEVLFLGLPDGEGSSQAQDLPSLLARIGELSLEAPASGGGSSCKGQQSLGERLLAAS